MCGLPLDRRKTFTKSDWVVWTATLTENENDFIALIDPIWKYADETTARVPISDLHETTNAKRINFKERSVVGGYFIKLLKEIKIQVTKKTNEKPFCYTNITITRPKLYG
ncbi:glutaminase domain-containing protein [Maribacter polysiphoniae]|uniref:glutaminase domain-containing protein n=1 Tax=Maribacter polysiphoniae TaxID=429344 RepID=UPI003741FAF9